MNRWKEKLEDHPIHETLSWLDNAISSNDGELAEEEVQEQRRLKKIIGQFKNILSSIDPEVVPFNQLDAMNTQLRNQNVTSQVNNYINNGNSSHLVAINDYIINQLTQLSLLSSLCEKDGSSTNNKLEELESLIDNSINALVRRRDELNDQISKLSSLSEEQTKKLDSLSTEIDQKEGELKKLSSEWQSQFSSAQESRSQEFSKWRDAFTTNKEKEANETIEAIYSKLEEDRKDFDGTLENIIDDSQLKHQSILDLYELTAGDSVGAAYIKSANDEGGEANKWRWISVAFIAVTVLWLLFSYFYNSTSHADISSLFSSQSASVADKSEASSSTVVKTGTPQIQIDQNENFPWQLLLITVSISGVLLWGAAYSAQQSTKHRNNEKRARWFALEVKAFDPFISSLDLDQQKELKKQLAERIFGQSSLTESKDSTVLDEHALKVVTDAFGSLLSKLPLKQ